MIIIAFVSTWTLIIIAFVSTWTFLKSFGKVYFNLIKLSLFCFIYFFFILLFFVSFRFFISFVFNGVRTISLKESYPLPFPIVVRVWFSFRVRARIGVKYSSRAICPRTVFTGCKKGDFLLAIEMLGFIRLLYVQSCTFLKVLNELNGVS